MSRLICLALYLLMGCLRAGADPPATTAVVTHYDSDSAHLWNRLHAALFTRPDRDDKIVGGDALDPLVFPTTKRLLEGPTHTEALRLLDEFLANGHDLVRDPVKRVVLQRDLWALFDWAAYPFGNVYTDGSIGIRKGPLQERLAKAIRKLAPSRTEVEDLPDTFALAVKSKALPVAFDATRPNDPFLPPDLFDPTGPWVCVSGPRSLPTPIASEHARVFAGRSAFLVFVRLPDDRKATLAYLETLNRFADPWKVPPREPGDRVDRPLRLELSPEIPQFPPGTQVALVRQLLVLTSDGKPVPTALTESVQLRTYREILPPEKETDAHAEKAQGFVELELRRADLFAEKERRAKAGQG